MTAAFLEPLVHASQPWADVYNDSTVLQTGITFAHFAGLLTAGGFAVATDRLALRISKEKGHARALLLRELSAVHRPVLIGLTVVTLTGLAMAMADASVFLTSAVFWLKMSAFFLLLINGAVMLRTERRLKVWSDVEAPESDGAARAWRGLRRTAVRSMGLWAVTLLLGTALTAV